MPAFYEMLTSYRSLEAGRGRRPIARSSWSMIAISSSVARWIVVPHGQLISLFSLNHVTVLCICAPHLGGASVVPHHQVIGIAA
jgi:hypothetical protein